MAAMVMNEIEAAHAFSHLDPLTRLPNRRQFEEDLLDLDGVGGAAGGTRLFILIDVASGDQLGQLGRAKGAAHVDEVMQDTSRVLLSVVENVKLYSVGVGQFAFVTRPGLDAPRYAAMLAKRFKAIRQFSSHRFVLTTGVGVVLFDAGKDNGADLLRRATMAAEQARSREDRVEMYCEALDAQQRRRMRLVDDFAGALNADDQLRLLYQPRIDLHSDSIVGVEALLRWTHPSLGEVSPAEFIPLVETTDLARPMTGWVLRQALDQVWAWRDAGLDLRMAVNVSAANLQEIDFAEVVLSELASRRLPTSTLEIELTESAFLADAGRATGHMEHLKTAGVTLALDDFGTGYSSLSYLQTLPAQVIKIDQSFVSDVIGDSRKRKIVASTIALAHSLGYSVVAEGVETVEVAAMLREIGCEEGQGYLWSRPAPAAQIEQMSGLRAAVAA